jgi:hypothetical protein
MSVSIKDVAGNDAARIFILDSTSPRFPIGEEYNFTSADDAKKSGYFLAGKALSNPLVTSVKVMRTDAISGYVGPSRDCIQIDLKAAFMWDSNVKGKYGSATGETVAQRYAQVIQREFVDGESVSYQAPVSAGQKSQNEISVLDKINGYLSQRLNDAAKTEKELRERKNAGYRPTVFDTISIHGGNIKALSYNNGILTSAFTDTCGGSGCFNNSTLATETGVTAELRPQYKFVRQFVFVKE